MQCVGKFEIIMFEIIILTNFLNEMWVKTKELIYGYIKGKLYKLENQEGDKNDGWC